MTVYLDLVVLLNFAVDFLLLLGTNRLCGYPTQKVSTVVSAIIGGIYAGACMIPGFSFLGDTVWRILSLIFMSVIAFGFDFSAVRRGAVFVMLCMALGGVSMGMGQNGFLGLLCAAAVLCGICALGFRGEISAQQYAKVLIRYKDMKISLTALKDTGNLLKDPISGESVMVVGSDVAQKLLGLTQDMLNSPITTMETYPILGLRLIPYRAVGQSGGMLLALRVDEVLLDGIQAGKVIAFAPQVIGHGEGYQALTGGAS